MNSFWQVLQARKALRALKALVRLQAIVRGRAVRRQAMTTLKNLQSLVKIQSQVCAKRLGMEDNLTEEKKELMVPNKESEDIETRLEQLKLESQRRWDDSLLSKEETNAVLLSKQEAMIKRERIKRYSYSYRERRRTELEPNNVDGVFSDWLEQWVDAQAWKRKQLENFDRVAYLDAIDREIEGGKLLRSRELQKYEQLEGFNSPMLLPRRSFHQSKRSCVENDPCSGFPSLPSYMAATESAKAKVRSISTPKQRLGAADPYSDHGSPSKHGFSFCSSNGSSATCTNRTTKPSCQQRSPRIKGIPVPIKSYQPAKDLSLDSLFSLPNWDQHKAFR
uniref:DUF4005 domain-containing protein n=1 Tax=Nelumbo nucifera TaxID=4432 RepID=A0A822YDC7_NELNU|nr:TPA_asm: hypothetical protein HUJ06_030999 [Nelumbo nucifera]